MCTTVVPHKSSARSLVQCTTYVSGIFAQGNTSKSDFLLCVCGLFCCDHTPLMGVDSIVWTNGIYQLMCVVYTSVYARVVACDCVVQLRHTPNWRIANAEWLICAIPNNQITSGVFVYAGKVFRDITIPQERDIIKKHLITLGVHHDAWLRIIRKILL